MRTIFSILALCFAVSACSPVAEQKDNTDPIAAFRLGHVAVVAPNLLQGPVSRDATPEEWIAVLKPAVQNRLRRLDGDQFYHIGVNVAGYALAPPGIPLVASPKSLLILDVNVIDDATRKQLNETPQQVVVGEGLSAETMISSGLVRTKDEQMEILAERAAGAIEAWLREEQQANGWFSPRPDDEDPAKSADDLDVESEVVDIKPQALDDDTDDLEGDVNGLNSDTNGPNDEAGGPDVGAQAVDQDTSL
jgi:hypothetical protein